MKSPQPLQSLKDRLAGLAKRGGSGEVDASGLAQASRALQELTPAKASEKANELRARIKAGVERLGKDSAGLGAAINAKVEALIKPRAVEPSAEDQPDAKRTSAASDSDADQAMAARIAQALPAADAPATSADEVGSEKSASAATSEPQPSLVTRTFGRVGLTAVHARLGARLGSLARAQKKTPALVPSSGATSDAPVIHRIDAELPLLTKSSIAAAADAVSVGASSLPRSGPTIPPVSARRQRSAIEDATRRRRASGRRRLAVGFGSLLTALVTGALVHLVTTFALPTVAPWFGKGSAYDRLKFKLDANVMKPFEVEATASQPLLPFLTPDMHYAFCRYDISMGAVAVSATLPDVGWSLALYTPQGDNFYAAPGIEGRSTELKFMISPSSDRLIIVPGVRRADVDATQVTSPTREGLVVLRAPYKGRAFEPSTRAAMAKASCEPVARR